MTNLRFPIGQFDFAGPLTVAQREASIHDIAAAPRNLVHAIEGLSQRQLDTPYRPGGWTVRQVVHHLPDSHVNSYVRLKLALTEDLPTIRTYDERRWAELPDAAGPVSMSVQLLTTLHDRWVYLFRHLTADDWTRQFLHPDLGLMRVDELLAYYAWHGRHHIMHITSLRDRENWGEGSRPRRDP